METLKALIKEYINTDTTDERRKEIERQIIRDYPNGHKIVKALRYDANENHWDAPVGGDWGG